jgi:hypothetical protein
MTNHSRTLLIFFGGIMAGGLTASIVEWSAFPKAAMAGLVATIVALGIGVATRSFPSSRS